MHSAKGLEFDQVMLLDDGTLADTPEERRLKLRLVEVVRERSDAPSRTAEYTEKLEVDEWFTAVWEARWRA